MKGRTLLEIKDVGTRADEIEESKRQLEALVAVLRG